LQKLLGVIAAGQNLNLDDVERLAGPVTDELRAAREALADAIRNIDLLLVWGGKTSVALRLPVRKRGVARSDADSTKQPGAEPQPTRTHYRPPVQRQLSHRCPSNRRPSFDSTVNLQSEMFRPPVASRMEQLHQLPAQRVPRLDCRAFTQVAGATC
jgi:hypothetical protein